MKSFACALLFVAAAYASPAAEAEADPALFYSGLGYNYVNGYAGYAVGNRVFNTYAAAPLAAAAVAAPVATVAAPAVAAPVVKSVISTPVATEVVAQPAAVATVATPAVAAPAVAYANNLALPYNYGYAGLYNAGLYSGLYNAGLYGLGATHVIAKREAEAEAEADPALFYSGLYGAYNYGYAGYGYAAPYASRAFAYGYSTPYAYGYAGYPYAARYLY